MMSINHSAIRSDLTLGRCEESGRLEDALSQLCPRTHTELAKDFVKVILDSAGTNEEL